MSVVNEEPEDDFSMTLVRRLRKGDDEAGEKLQDLYRVTLVRFAQRYLGDLHDAEDAVQDVFARILTSKAEPLNFRLWAYRIARNVCLNQLRSTGRRKDGLLLSTAFDVAVEKAGALTGIVRAEDAAELAATLDKLSEAQREVLVLRHFEGLGREEIATVLELPVSVVKSRLFEGVNRLRQLEED
jgi:RNA polymerase sigma-70 factor (ECF subfamily)